MPKKGQAAMEFLMTYGWAVLLVMVAITALAYFGILQPVGILPERCTGPAGLDCIEKASLVGDTVSWASKNNMGYNIVITALTNTADSDCIITGNPEWNIDNTVWIDTSATILNGDTLGFRAVCAVGYPTEKLHAEFDMEYNSPSSGVNGIARYEMDIRH